MYFVLSKDLGSLRILSLLNFSVSRYVRMVPADLMTLVLWVLGVSVNLIICVDESLHDPRPEDEHVSDLPN